MVRRGEVQVARYQIWMNSRNMMIWCSLRGRILRLLHERIATPDFARPIHSRLQALARMSRPAIAHTHERSEWSPERGKRRALADVWKARSTRHGSQEPGACLLDMPSMPHNLSHAVGVASPRKLARTHD